MMPRLPSLQSIATVVLVGASVWASWTLASIITEKREKKKADARVEEVVKAANERFTLQRELTMHYKGLAEEQINLMLFKLDNMKVEHVTITRNITRERESNPEFYNTPLPEGGLKEWDAARQLLR